MTDDDYLVYGGVNTYDRSGMVKNLRQAIALEPYPNNTKLINELRLALISGVIPSTTSDIISAITARTGVSGDVALAVYPAYFTPVNINNVCSGALQSAYTVTTGKKFYLMACTFQQVAAGQCLVYKTDGTTPVILMNTLATTLNDRVISSVPIWVYNSGEFVKVNGNNTATCNFWGFEI